MNSLPKEQVNFTLGAFPETCTDVPWSCNSLLNNTDLLHQDDFSIL